MDARACIQAQDFLEIQTTSDVLLHVQAFDIFGGWDDVQVTNTLLISKTNKDDISEEEIDDIESAFDKLIDKY